MILHCMTRKAWEAVRQAGRYDLSEGQKFLHGSSVSFFWRVAPNFKNVSEEMVLLCIAEERLEPEIRWEDSDGCGREYPHIYGTLNIDAVEAVLPYLRDEDGNWMKNPELAGYPDI